MFTTITRPALAVVVAVAAAIAAITVPARATAAQDEAPPAERRITSGRDTLQGRGESGVSVQSISALTNRGGRSAEGETARRVGACRWAVAWRPRGPLEESTAALSLRPLSGELPSDAGFFVAFRAETEAGGHGLIAGGADPDRLRFVVPYGSDECSAAAGAFITLGEVEDLARRAFAEMQQRWPAQEIVLGWPEPTEDTWTALTTDLAWGPISATAASGGLTVTVTATPVSAVWDTGQINTRVGGERTVRCDGPGDLPHFQADASCRVWLASPSTGLVDRHGQANTITLGLTVEWNVGYTSNFAGFSDPAWLTWPTESFLDGVVVNTTQAVAVGRT